MTNAEVIARAMFARSHDEPWEQADPITKDTYLQDARVAFDTMKVLIAAHCDEAIISAALSEPPAP